MLEYRLEAKLIVFDVGGTVIRDTADVASVFTAALQRHGIMVPFAKIQSLRGASKRDAIKALARAADEDPEDVYRTFQKLLLARLVERGVEPIQGIEPCFERLRGHRIKLALTTGFDTKVMNQILEQLRWQNMVDVIITSDDVVRGRPQPDQILAAMRNVAVPNTKSVVSVGDTVNDLLAAEAADVGASIGILTGAHNKERLKSVVHTAILHSAADVPRWLEEHCWVAM